MVRAQGAAQRLLYEMGISCEVRWSKNKRFKMPYFEKSSKKVAISNINPEACRKLR